MTKEPIWHPAWRPRPTSAPYGYCGFSAASYDLTIWDEPGAPERQCKVCLNHGLYKEAQRAGTSFEYIARSYARRG